MPGQWKEGRTTFQRVYGAISGTQEPASAETVGERARCSTNGARRALEKLVEMGVAERRDGRPVTYRRNDAYFTWRRVESLAEEYTADELRQRVADFDATHHLGVLFAVLDRIEDRVGSLYEE